MQKGSKQKEDDEKLMELISTASSKAVRSSYALGLPVQFIEDNDVIEVSAGGKRRVIKKIKRVEVDLSGLKKGMILKRK